MNEYLYEIACGKYSVSDLSDEEIVYVVFIEKIHANKKRKFKSRSIYCRGDLAEKGVK